jgi:hypothetical protein
MQEGLKRLFEVGKDQFFFLLVILRVEARYRAYFYIEKHPIRVRGNLFSVGSRRPMNTAKQSLVTRFMHSEK